MKNNTKNILIVLKGLPASGKSTYAQILEESGTFERVCLDTIREELYGNESIQGDGKKVFEIAQTRMHLIGMRGGNCVYDATNLKQNRRIKLVEDMRNYFDVLIIKEFTTPYLICCERNKARDRVVPSEVMVKMFVDNEQAEPSEGWDYIEQIENY
jgi:predicted kinase